ncbi:HPr-rel-A system PqqD family peptide chaperone [Parasphingorhabdus sp.]|uniref:HPr-rel-A system PqqD family peptide chaperone n=1 Tax=Parasphingorhabdus sp. TaxID=2709688 RepID=UPI0030037CA0
MTPKYRAAAADDLIWHELDSMTLLFHRTSGITHMLADPAPAILDVMADRAMSAPEIAAFLATEYDVELATDTETIVLARLEELSALGLVSRITG